MEKQKTNQKHEHIKIILRNKLFQIVASICILLISIAVAYAIMFRSFEAKYEDAQIKSHSPNIIK